MRNLYATSGRHLYALAILLFCPSVMQHFQIARYAPCDQYRISNRWKNDFRREYYIRRSGRLIGQFVGCKAIRDV